MAKLEELVKDDVWLVDAGTSPADRVFVEYRILGAWRVRISAALYAPVAGPSEVVIAPESDAVLGDSDVAEGITTHVLRRIPMVDARKRLDRLAAEEYKKERTTGFLPQRFKSDEDFARLAKVFVEKADEGDPNPVRAIALELGKSRNTVGVRIVRARSMGLLTPEGEKPQLTAKAEEILGLERRDG